MSHDGFNFLKTSIRPSLPQINLVKTVSMSGNQFVANW